MELGDDDRWAGLTGGYRRVYDPRKAIRRLAEGDSSAWEELWQELHHQGDVGEASYAALPALTRVHRDRAVSDWNIYALAVLIEVARHNPGNPPVPTWMLRSYEAAWRDLEMMALNELPQATGDDLIHSLFAALAVAKGRPTLARMAMLTEDERRQMLDLAGWG
jgi:hypothetical protein